MRAPTGELLTDVRNEYGGALSIRRVLIGKGTVEFPPDRLTQWQAVDVARRRWAAV